MGGNKIFLPFSEKTTYFSLGFYDSIYLYLPIKATFHPKTTNPYLNMKKLLPFPVFGKAVLLLMMVLWLQPAFPQSAMIELNASRSATEVTGNNFQKTRVNFSFGQLDVLEVKTEHGYFTELILPQGYSVGTLGTPKLPAAKNLIEVPFGAEVEVNVLSYTTKEYRLADYGISNPLMPLQPSLRKDQEVSEVPFEYQMQAYTKNAFTENELAHIEVLGVMRGMRIARLTVAPVSYNPVENTLKVYNDIELEITYTGADRELTNYIKASTYSPYFDVAYSKVLNPFGNRDIFDDHPDLTKYPIGMIVVAHRNFEETLQPFLEWKTQQGFFLHVAYTDEIGTTPTAIRNHIHGIYNAATPENPAPTFLVVVGDHPSTMPASATGSSSNAVTDLYYASVDGDMFPEMYYGRFSARNTQELQNQIDKLLYYERYEFTDPTYLNDVTLIAGQDGTWNPRIGQPTVHYGTQNYFNAAHGFTNVNAYLTNYTGCYDNARISVSLINFTAHCSPTSWAGPYLTVNDVHNMTNTGKYPLAIGNCCQSSLFSHSESVGEAWVRAANKGAVAYIGSAPNTYWFEDFYWAVGAFPLQGTNNGYVPTAEETTLGMYDAPFVSDYLAVGAMKVVGNLAVTEVHIQGYPTHSSPLYYWQAYHTFGDPSTVIYLTEGDDNAVSHLPILPIGLDTYTVTALPGSYVAISKDGHLHGAAFVDATGEVDVPIEPVLDGGDVLVVVTRPQTIPYIESVPAAALEGPFVVLDHYMIQGEPSYNQSISLDVTIKNVGADPVGTVSAVLTGDDPYITIINSGQEVEFDGMNSGDTGNTSLVEDAFQVEIAVDVPDQYQATFQLVITDGDDNEWTSNLRITAQAPVFAIDHQFTIDDSQGNGNGRLDPGESAVITFMVTNSGSAKAMNPQIEIGGNSPYLIIEPELHDLEPIAAGETIAVDFLVHAHQAASEGTFVDLNLYIEDGHFYATESIIVIGQVPEMSIGDGQTASVHYPFYNWYKANRSQMLYLNSELGAGEKVITELGFYITRFSTSYNNLPNFKILIKHTDITQVGNAFVDMTGATEVFSVPAYQMPEALGLHVWDIDNFVYDGVSNLIVEIVWGQLPHYILQHYQVASTVMPNPMVAFGYSDTHAVPPYNGNSSTRPNLFLAFAAEATEDAQEVTFVVKDSNNDLMENAGIKIGSLTRNTDQTGETSFTLLPGTYYFHATAEGHEPILNQEFVVTYVPQTIEVNFAPVMNVLFNINDSWGNTITDASITIDGHEHEPGHYQIGNLPAGNYDYVVTREGYFDYSGNFELSSQSLEINVTLQADGTGTGITDEDLKYRVFPNPTRNQVYVRMQHGQGDLQITLMNYQGQVVEHKQLSAAPGETTIKFSLGSYAAGIYYLRISDGKSSSMEKIILQ
jgi:hypothetical protein